jgi:NAD(P)-dependent dehydrogenase (short-subunit alcohol dehydrogenase family)
MQIKDSVALVTGANRGLGRHIAAQLLERGAARVYAGARDPGTVDLPGVVPLQLDITDPASVARAAETAGDVTLLVNNAGISTRTSLLTGDLDAVHREFDTNFFGTLAALRAFAPVLTRNGGGAVLNVLSVLSWWHPSPLGAYSAAKAASWGLTNAARDELAPAGVQVTGLHVGYMDTDMAAAIAPEDKVDPAVVAALALDGVEAGLDEVLADAVTRSVKAGLGSALAQA